jgi:nickel-dependent lactate racemase
MNQTWCMPVRYVWASQSLPVESMADLCLEVRDRYQEHRFCPWSNPPCHRIVSCIGCYFKGFTQPGTVAIHHLGGYNRHRPRVLVAEVRMSPVVYSVPYSEGELTFQFPAGFKEATVVHHRAVASLGDVSSSIRSALSDPLNSPPLRDLARPGDKVCIVVTDLTRPCPDHLLVPALLEELTTAGVEKGDITLLVGVGMHRPTTEEEKRQKLGRGVAEEYDVHNSDPLDPEKLADLGLTSGGIPAVVSKVASEADLLIATGVVEPHLYAGYSGGRKTVAIGAGGERTIELTHGPQMLDQPGTRLGRIEGNPFHQAIAEIARRAGLRFILNVVLDSAGSVVTVGAGEPEATFERLVEKARSFCEVVVSQQYDVVIGGVGYPKDVNLYQASRAPTYLFFAPRPLVKKGGTIIIPARCQEGIGQGLGERRFHELMRSARDPEEIVETARREGYPAGGQRAFVVAKVLQECEVVIVGSEQPGLVEEAKMLPVADMNEAFQFVERKHGRDAEVLVVPDALHVVPVVAE